MTTITDLHEAYSLDHRARQLSENYRISIDQTVTHLTQFDCPPIEAITAETIRRFLLYLGETRGLAATSIRIHYRNVKALLEFATNEQLIPRNPCNGVRPPKADDKPPEVLQPDEVLHMLTAVRKKSHLEYCVLLFFFDTGVRLEELVNIKISDINFKTGECIIRKGKGRKQRTVRMGAVLCRELKLYIMRRKIESDALFLNRRGKPYGYSGINALVHRCLIDHTSLTRKRGAHVLRHSFALADMLKNKRPERTQHLMGHSSIETTMKYGRLAKLLTDDGETPGDAILKK